jgi:hypothetical protein
MTTNNLRIEVYINPDTYTKLRQFMQQNALTEANAIDLIVREYLDTHLIDGSKTKTEQNFQVQLSPPAIPRDDGLTQVQLAERLNCDIKELERIRDYPVVLADYTRDRDPQGQAWEYNPDSLLFFPLE